MNSKEIIAITKIAWDKTSHKQRSAFIGEICLENGINISYGHQLIEEPIFSIDDENNHSVEEKGEFLIDFISITDDEDSFHLFFSDECSNDVSQIRFITDFILDHHGIYSSDYNIQIC